MSAGEAEPWPKVSTLRSYGSGGKGRAALGPTVQRAAAESEQHCFKSPLRMQNRSPACSPCAQCSALCHQQGRGQYERAQEMGLYPSQHCGRAAAPRASHRASVQGILPLVVPQPKVGSSPEKQLRALPSSTTHVPLPHGTCSWCLRAPRELWQGASHLRAASVMVSTGLLCSLLPQYLHAASSQWGVEAAAHVHSGGILASTNPQQPIPSLPSCRLCVAELAPECHCQHPSARTPRRALHRLPPEPYVAVELWGSVTPSTAAPGPRPCMGSPGERDGAADAAEQEGVQTSPGSSVLWVTNYSATWSTQHADGSVLHKTKQCPL